jgi:APA family basic amino acid/polyamine antiporter
LRALSGDGAEGLKPTLGQFDATAISIRAIIGAGIFVVTGIAAGLTGPASILSMILAALISLLTALSFSRLTSAFPDEGARGRSRCR